MPYNDTPDGNPPPVPVHVGPDVRDVEAGLHRDHHPWLQGSLFVCPPTVMDIHPEVVTDLVIIILVT